MIIFTDWFTTEAPVHVGVYQVLHDSGIWFQHWDGDTWGASAATPDRAYEARSWEGDFQSLPWRGLMKRIA